MRAPIRWLRAPLWVAAVATGAKSFVDNPILGSERLNQLGLHAARLRLAHRLAAIRRRRLARRLPADLREEFDRNGFVELRDFLPSDTFKRLRDTLLSMEFECREQQQGNAVTRRVVIDAEQLRRIPDLGSVVNNRSLRGLLAYGASTRTQPIYQLQAVLMGHLPGDPDPQLELHADTFHPSLKAWLFLTDVTDDQGPLTYVPGSHRLTAERLAWEQEKSVNIRESDRLSQRGSLRVTTDELKRLNYPHPRRFAVPANTLVMIDTCGFHARGSCSKPTIRAEIWAYVRRTPFLPWTGLDLLSLPPFAMQRGTWMLRLVDKLDRLGFAKQHWQPAGRKRILDR